MNDRLSYEEKKELPVSVFGHTERREYPMPQAKEHGVDIKSPTIIYCASEWRYLYSIWR